MAWSCTRGAQLSRSQALATQALTRLASWGNPQNDEQAQESIRTTGCLRQVYEAHEAPFRRFTFGYSEPYGGRTTRAQAEPSSGTGAVGVHDGAGTGRRRDPSGAGTNDHRAAQLHRRG